MSLRNSAPANTMIFGFLLFAVACSESTAASSVVGARLDAAGDPVPVTTSSARLQISASSRLLTPGQQATLTVKSLNSAGRENRFATSSYSWASSSPTIASVESATGRVTANAPGVALISVVQSGSVPLAASLSVTVSSPAPDPATVLNGVSVSPASVSVEESSTQQLTASVLSLSGTPLSGSTLGWSSSNASVATVGATGLLTAISAGVAQITVTATLGGVSRSAVTSVMVTAAPPQATGFTIASLSRDAGSTAGGTKLTITGSGYTSASTVSFGGTPATQVTFVNATTLQAVVPAHAAGVVDVAVSVNGSVARLAGGFSFEPAPSRVYVSSSFEGSNPFGGGGTITTSVPANSGTRSLMLPNMGLYFYYGNAGNSPANPPLSEANGLYQRWYVRLPQATLNNAQSTVGCQNGNATCGQMKMMLNRYNGTQTLAAPGWLEPGIGYELRSYEPGGLWVYGDYYGRFYTGLTPGMGTRQITVLRADRWYEIQTWYKKVGTIGYVKMWLDGKLVIYAADELNGSASAADQLSVALGSVYSQQTLGPMTVYVDDVSLGNGFFDPPSP